MKIELSECICKMVYKMPVEKNKLLFISVRCNYDFYEKDIHIELPTSTVNFIFHKASNYIKVLFVVLNDIFIFPEHLIDMKLTSYHDSCWRSDGVSSPLTKFHHNKCEELKQEINKKIDNYADKFHKLIYASYPSFALFHRSDIIDGTVIISDNRDHNYNCIVTKTEIGPYYTFK